MCILVSYYLHDIVLHTTWRCPRPYNVNAPFCQLLQWSPVGVWRVPAVQRSAVDAVLADAAIIAADAAETSTNAPAAQSTDGNARSEAQLGILFAVITT